MMLFGGLTPEMVEQIPVAARAIGSGRLFVDGLCPPGALSGARCADLLGRRADAALPRRLRENLDMLLPSRGIRGSPSAGSPRRSYGTGASGSPSWVAAARILASFE